MLYRTPMTNFGPKLGLLGFLVTLPAWTGCAYTFTNTHVQRPSGVESVAVEAIYDTSREVLPHELLWQSLQDAFASDGHLRLAPEAAADALVRAHIKAAQISPIGSNPANGVQKDPQVFDHTSPSAPARFRTLTQAGQYRDKGQVVATVEVEVWNLHTRELLMKRTYPLSDPFQAIHNATPGVNRPNDHLRYQEAVDASFKTIADNISRNVVRDLLVH